MLMDPAQMVQRLDAALQLSDDQKAKITDLVAKQGEQMQALRAKMQEMQKATHDQIRAVLTADQQARFDAMMPPARVAAAIVAAPAAMRPRHLRLPRLLPRFRHLRPEVPPSSEESA